MTTQRASRLISIDAFRGLTIALMILVNMPGSWNHVYEPLEHAAWFGWTLADLVFPWFLFICGVSIVFSFVHRTHLYRHIAFRSALIVLIGLLINFIPACDFATWRFSGVLQRIGIAYFFAALIYRQTSLKQQAMVVGVILIGYWWLVSGDLTPEGNLVGKIDRLILGVHGRAPTDPEGILSTLPSIASVLLGCMVGEWLRAGAGANNDKRTVFRGLASGGMLLLFVGLVWSFGFPIGKKLWTSSFVIFTTGTAMIWFAVLYAMVEMQGRAKWVKPLVVFGSNALTAYVLHILAIRLLMWKGWYTPIWRHLFVPWAGEWMGSFAFAVANVVFWWGVMSLFYRQRIFIKL